MLCKQGTGAKHVIEHEAVQFRPGPESVVDHTNVWSLIDPEPSQERPDGEIVVIPGIK